MTGKDFWKAFAPVLGLLIVFVIAFFFIYRNELGYGKTPTVEVISGNEIVTDQSEVPVTGVVRNTDTLRVNGKEVSVSGDGGFNTAATVPLGESEVVVVAGKKKQTRITIKVTREEVAKAVLPADVVSGVTSDLSTTGPVESVMGAIGLAAILVSLYVYRRSVRWGSLQGA